MTRGMQMILLLALFACSGCSTIETGADVDQSVDFTTYRTAAWLFDGVLVAPDSGPISPLMDSRIRDAVSFELESRGIRTVVSPDSADLVIVVVIGARDRIDDSVYPLHYRSHSGPCGSMCRSGQSRPRTYTQGSLSLDFYDTTSGKPVWHGWIKKTITQSDREKPKAILNEAIGKLFADFPLQD